MTASPTGTPSAAESAPPEWTAYDLVEVGVRLSLPPEWEAIEASQFDNAVGIEALKERYPDNPALIDSLIDQVRSGTVLIIAYDFRPGQTVDGLGTQVTIGRYPNPIAGLGGFQLLVVEAMKRELNVQGEIGVDRLELAIGPVSRLQFVHRVQAAGGATHDHDIAAVQYVAPNGGKPFFASLATVAQDDAAIEAFDLAMRTASRLP